MGIDVDAINALQLTQLKVIIDNAGRTRNLADDLEMLETQVRRMLPDVAADISKWLLESDTDRGVPTRLIVGDVVLELKSQLNGNTVLTISSSPSDSPTERSGPPE